MPGAQHLRSSRYLELLSESPSGEAIPQVERTPENLTQSGGSSAPGAPKGCKKQLQFDQTGPIPFNLNAVAETIVNVDAITLNIIIGMFALMFQVSSIESRNMRRAMTGILIGLSILLLALTKAQKTSRYLILGLIVTGFIGPLCWMIFS